MTDARFASNIFFDAWCDHTHHLPRMLPITQVERARGASFPARALEAAVRDTYTYLHVILGYSPREAQRACERFADATVEWTCTDGRDRAALQAALRQEETLRHTSAAEPATLDESSNHPWLSASMTDAVS